MSRVPHEFRPSPRRRAWWRRSRRSRLPSLRARLRRSDGPVPLGSRRSDHRTGSGRFARYRHRRPVPSTRSDQSRGGVGRAACATGHRFRCATIRDRVDGSGQIHCDLAVLVASDDPMRRPSADPLPRLPTDRRSPPAHVRRGLKSSRLALDRHTAMSRPTAFRSSGRRNRVYRYTPTGATSTDTVIELSLASV